MSNPLPDSTVSTLRTNETAALAAAMIIAGSFPDIASFAARVAGGPPDAPKPLSAAKRRRRGNGHGAGREGEMLKRDDKLAALIRRQSQLPRCLAA
jgi:hypothetical protein